MANGAGVFGFGAGNLVKAFMDAKFKQQAKEQEDRRLDEAERQGMATRLQTGHTDFPEEEQRGLIQQETPKKGLVPYAADQTSQDISSVNTGGLVHSQNIAPTQPIASTVPPTANPEEQAPQA